MKLLFTLLFICLGINANCQQKSSKEISREIKLVDKWIDKFQKQANAGDMDAVLTLAAFYGNPVIDGVEHPDWRNTRTRAEWLSRAAYAGNLMAIFELGKYYQLKEINELNMDSCFHYYKTAGNMGYAPAWDSLGTIYENGLTNDRIVFIGFKPARLIDSAFKYYSDAAALGHEEYNYNIGHLYLLSMDAKQHTDAINWFKKAATKGYQPAIDMLDDYETAKDIPYDRAVAAIKAKQDSIACNFWRIASMINYDTLSMIYYGCCLSTGTGVQKNNKLALYWLNKAGELGSGNAYYIAGDICEGKLNYYDAETYYLKSKIKKYGPAEAALERVKELNYIAEGKAAKQARKETAEQEENVRRGAMINDQPISTQIVKVKFCYDCMGSGNIYNVFNGVKLSSWHACGACNGKGYIK